MYFTFTGLQLDLKKNGRTRFQRELQIVISWAIWVNIVKMIFFFFKVFWYLIIDCFICDPWKTEIGVIRDLLFHIGMADWQKRFQSF